MKIGTLDKVRQVVAVRGLINSTRMHRPSCRNEWRVGFRGRIVWGRWEAHSGLIGRSEPSDGILSLDVYDP
jgi:hypothetical protein